MLLAFETLLINEVGLSSFCQQKYSYNSEVEAV